MPQAPVSLGQSAGSAMLAGHIGPIFDIGTLPLVLQALLRIGDAPA